VRILIVEDEPQMAGLLAHGLEEELYEVRVAKDGKAALDLSASNEFDVILLDVMLPKIGGLEVARQLRQREQSTPLLMTRARMTISPSHSRFRNCSPGFERWCGATNSAGKRLWRPAIWYSTLLRFALSVPGARFICL
jgi:CheY-like chemotaxis protein